MREELSGNTQGLKASQSRRLLATWRRRVQQRELVSAELARHLTEVSREIGRQFGVLINRRGEIEHVIVGDARQLILPDIGRARAGQARLRGLRLVHTHLKNEPLTRDDLTDLVLLRLDAVVAIVALEDGLPGKVYVGTLLPFNPSGELYRQTEAASVYELAYDPQAEVEALEQEMARAAPVREVGAQAQAILIGVHRGNKDAADRSLAELAELARTANVQVLDKILQSRAQPDPRTLVGEGKLQDILVRSMALGADMLIFDRNLMPSQARHISEATALKILDRTQLILDIFAQRAQSADGKLQVELAQLKYLLPRLVGKDDSLSRLGAGIGGRGPGETKLEVDRRRARDRISQLEKAIDRLSSDRATRRRQRNRSGVPVVSIVGYTNAGKSTLLNSLTHSTVLAEDKLFATLDPTSRRLKFPGRSRAWPGDGPEAEGRRQVIEREVIITDTVGFIRDLPKDLINAFRATLEELEEADLLLHVVDASDPQSEEQAAAVERVLATLEVKETPRLLVFNKADRAPERAATLAMGSNGVAIAALTGQGFPDLIARCEEILWKSGKVLAPGEEPEFARPRRS